MKIAKNTNHQHIKVDNDIPSFLFNLINEAYIQSEEYNKDLIEYNKERVKNGISKDQVNYGIFNYSNKNPELSEIVTRLNEDIKKQLKNKKKSFSFDSGILDDLYKLKIKDENNKKIKSENIKYMLLALVKQKFSRFKPDIEKMLYRDNKVSSSEKLSKKLILDFYKNDKFIEKLSNSLNHQKPNISINDDGLQFNESKKYITKMGFEYIKTDNNRKDEYLQEITNYFFNYGVEFKKISDKNKTEKIDRDYKYIVNTEKIKKVNKQIDKKCQKMHRTKCYAFIKIENEKNNNEITVDVYNEKKYWIHFIYDEAIKILKSKSNYVNSYEKLDRKIRGKLKNIITMQILDLGKIVEYTYNFDKKDENTNFLKNHSLTSMDYEFIKFSDEFKISVHQYLTLAIQSFLNIIETNDLTNDIPKAGDSINKNKKQLLAFWGGYNNFENENINILHLAQEINNCLYQLRNDFMHKNSKTKEITTEELDKLIRYEVVNYGRYLYDMYSSNNVFTYYKFEKIQKDIIDKCYNFNNSKDELQYALPSFSKICPRSQYMIGINEELSSCSYFLKKEVYNSYFRYSLENIQYFNKAIENLEKKYNDNQENNHIEAFKSFQEFIKVYCKDEKTISVIYKKVIMFFAETKGNKNIHIKLIFNQLVGMAFDDFINNFSYENNNTKTFNFINNPDITNKNQSLEEKSFNVKVTNISFNNDQIKLWYVFFKLCSPNALSKLHGVIESYESNVHKLNNKIKALNTIQNKLNSNSKTYQLFNTNYEFQPIIELNEFLKLYSGRLSSDYTNYYENKEQYRDTLCSFIDFQDMSVDEFQKIDKLTDENKPKTYIYADGDNPIIHRTIEHAKMYSIYNFLVSNFEKDKSYKVSKSEFDDYCKSEFQYEDESNITDSNKLSEYYKNKYEYIALRNKVLLYDISTMSNTIFELYGKLISYMYRYERDQMYFLLGFMYLLYINDDKIDKNINHKNITTVKNIFIYGKDLQDNDKDKDSKKSINSKFNIFFNTKKNKNIDEDNINLLRDNINILMYKSKFQNLKTNDKHNKFFTDSRNSIDHFVLFKNNSYLYDKIQSLNNDIENIKKQKLETELSKENKNELKKEIKSLENNIKRKETEIIIQNSSILEFYNIMVLIFAYDRKVKNSIIPSFQNILSRNFIDINLQENPDIYKNNNKNLYGKIFGKQTKSNKLSNIFDNYKQQYIINENEFDQNFKSRDMIVKNSKLKNDYSYNRYNREYNKQLYNMITYKKNDIDNK